MTDGDVFAWRVNAEQLAPAELIKLSLEEQMEVWTTFMGDIQDFLDLGSQRAGHFLVTAIAPSTTSAYASAPSGVQEWAGGAYHRAVVDLTGAVECRMSARVVTVGATGARLAIQGSGPGLGSFGYLDGVDAPHVAIDATGTPFSAWVPITALLRTDTELRVVTTGGDGSASPAVGLVVVEFR